MAAQNFASQAQEILGADDLEGVLQEIQSKDLSAAYSRYLIFVHRFIVAEMDTDAPSKRGIGRLADSDPPPRLGAKYRKQLRSEDARRSIGLAAERLMLLGFAAQAAFYNEGLDSVDREDDAWAMWLRHLSAYYNDTSELADRARNEERSNVGLTGAMLIILGDHGGGELVEGFEEHRIIKGLRKNTWHNARAASYLLLMMGAGRALHHVLSDEVDPTFGSLQSVRLLEDYREKRSKRQMIAQVYEED